MNGKTRRTTEYLEHMLEAIRRINAYKMDLDRQAFDADTRTQDAVIGNLEVIGEAARVVSQFEGKKSHCHDSSAADSMAMYQGRLANAKRWDRSYFDRSA